MKKLMASTMVLALVASTAGATGWGSKPNNNTNTNKNYNTNVAHGGNGGAGGNGGHGGAGGAGGNANQGQAQGQGQSQVVNTGQTYGIGGGANQGQTSNNAATNAGNAQAVNVTTNNKRSAYAPDSMAGECGFGISGGVPGAAGGVSIPGKHCRVLVEAELIEYYWGKSAAGQHLYDNNRRIRKTVGKQISNQQVAPSKVSTRNRVASAPSAPAGEDR